MSTVYWLKSPLSVPVSSKKVFVLNLNQYRNTHFIVLNKAKKNYKALVANQVNKLPEFKQMELKLVLYPKTKRLTDIDNICSVHLKFLLDAITSAGKLPDDNYEYVPLITYRIGSVCKDDPRVDVFIQEYSHGKEIPTQSTHH